MAGRTSKGLPIKFGTQVEHAKLFLGLAAAGLIALGMSGAARAGDVYGQTIHVSAAGLDVRTPARSTGPSALRKRAWATPMCAP
jgi:hypothetical protein